MNREDEIKAKNRRSALVLALLAGGFFAAVFIKRLFLQ